MSDRAGKDVVGEYDVDFFEFFSAMLAFQPLTDRSGLGVVNFIPDLINGQLPEDEDPELAKVNTFTITQEHAARNMAACARSLGLSAATLRSMAEEILSTKENLPGSYPMLRNLVRALRMKVASA